MPDNQTRRNFLGKLALTASAYALADVYTPLHAETKAVLEAATNKNPLLAAADEDYWRVVQQNYSASSSNILILNNGGVSPPPIPVQRAVAKYNELADQGPSYYMWRIIDQGREPVRYQLSVLAGCPPEELAINRNATEALNTVIYGLDLKAGDEVIGCMHDYPNMVQAWKQRKEREGIVYKQLSFSFPIEDDEAIVDAYRKAITDRTKLIHITHVINWVGQIMPVKKISAMAKEKGIEILVDGAHSFGLLDFKIPELGCDYFGTSLHKFLSAPVGTGMLWVKKEKIGKIWPLLCNGDPRSNDIRKFETLGTRSFPLEQGIGEAVRFHQAIGSKRKEERIRYLKDYWAKQALEIPGIRLHTSLLPAYSCAICGVSIDGMATQALDNALFNRYKIHVTTATFGHVDCLRVTPHVYTSLEDLDKFVLALKTIASEV